jgi:primary-amine oxidase
MQDLVRKHYGITDLALLACDPWSVHIAEPAKYAPLHWREAEHSNKNGAQNGQNGETAGATSASAAPPRLVQTWLYRRDDADDNHYAHPLPLLPIVDLNAGKVIALQVRPPLHIPRRTGSAGLLAHNARRFC